MNGQRAKAKRVNETTFYALIQYFAIILFECKDCEDFLPARHLMSLCFTFFQEGKANFNLFAFLNFPFGEEIQLSLSELRMEKTLLMES